jgi:ligand-binding sensor domain-containing protein/signal transduction histidine kinase
MINRFTLIALFLLFLSFEDTYVFALNPQRRLSQYTIHNWQTKDGLPQNSIRSIAQTADGYIWLSTGSGLVKFDGLKFSVLEKGNTSWMPSDGVGPIHAGKDGSLWMGSESIFRMKDGRVNTYHFKNAHMHLLYIAIYEDSTGTLWAGTNGHGLVRIKDGNLSLFTTKDGLSNDYITSITEDKDGSIWLATHNGLTRIKNGEFKTLVVESISQEEWVTICYGDSEGNLWFSTPNGKLFQLKITGDDVSSNDILKIGIPDNVNKILHITKDKDGNLWLATEGRGLVRYNPPSSPTNLLTWEYTHHSNQSIITDPDVTSIMEDIEGNLWLGTRKLGIVRLQNGKFINHSVFSGLPDNEVRAVHETEDGKLWIASGRMLCLVENEKVQIFSKDDGLPGFNIKTLASDKQGRIWIGTYGYGLYVFNRGKISLNQATSKIRRFQTLYFDKDDNLWIGTEDTGLHILKNNQLHSFSSKDGLPHDNIRFIMSTKNGQIWIGTKAGLSKFLSDQHCLNSSCKSRFVNYSKAEGLLDPSIRTMYEDTESNLWIGTYQGGLSRFNNGTFKTFTSRHGLYYDSIYEIQEDEYGYLWMGTRRGIFKVDKKELKAFEMGQLETINSTAYDSLDGMISHECNIDAHYTSKRSETNRLMFATTRGIVEVKPKDIRINQVIPPVYIEKVILDKQTIEMKEKIKIAPGKGDVEIHYIGLSYTAAEKVKYKYKLEGWDTEWIEVGTRRAAYYNNLPPGEYRFTVKACNNDGIWNDRGETLSLHVTPHFYQTYWFYILCLAFVSTLAFLEHRRRIKEVEARYQAVHAERSRIAREVHDTLLQGVIGIQAQLEAISLMFFNSPSAAKKQLDRLCNQSRKVLEESRLSIWGIRNPKIVGDGIAKALPALINELKDSSNKEIQLQLGNYKHNLSAELENNILRITQEAITNAIKHANAQFIYVDFDIGEQYVYLCIKDDGTGFDVKDQQSSHQHFGLIGIKERAAHVGGRLTINSLPGAGTEITLVVPVYGD